MLSQQLDPQQLRGLASLRASPPFETPDWLRASDWLARAEQRMARLSARAGRPRVLSAKSAVVVGDLHGDLGALYAARLWRDKMRPESELVLLGDLVDRGPASASTACVCIYWWLKGSEPGVTIVAGNHDVAIRRDGDSDRFVSSSTPSEFALWIDGAENRGLRHRLAELFVQVVRRLPKWVLLPGGLLGVHGSVPHADALSTVGSLAELESTPLAAQDLLWLRLAADVRRKRPNRRSQGCEIGLEDIQDGLDRFQRLLRDTAEMTPIRGLLRGHDHVASRRHIAWTPDQRPIVTLNSMSFPLPEDSLDSGTARPVIALVDSASDGSGYPVVTVHSLEMP